MAQPKEVTYLVESLFDPGLLLKACPGEDGRSSCCAAKEVSGLWQEYPAVHQPEAQMRSRTSTKIA
jgi:hypothetical protein